MVSKGQLVTLQARVVDCHDKSNVQLTIDDAENTRDDRDNHFVLTARALELAMARCGPTSPPTENADLGEPLHGQIDRLAKVIIDEIPGEPSENEGAVDTAIRLLRAAYIGKVESAKVVAPPASAAPAVAKPRRGRQKAVEAP